MAELDELISQAEAEGYRIVQQGRVLIPDTKDARLSFNERVEGFDIHLLGVHDESNEWRSPYENKLFDDRERWVHMRRDR